MVRPWMLLQGVSFNITNVSAFSVSFMIKDPSNPTSFWGASERKSRFGKIYEQTEQGNQKSGDGSNCFGDADEDKLRKLYEFAQTQIKNTSFDASLTDEDRKNCRK
jgi:hypothetical protein